MKSTPKPETGKSEDFPYVLHDQVDEETLQLLARLLSRLGLGRSAPDELVREPYGLEKKAAISLRATLGAVKLGRFYYAKRSALLGLPEKLKKPEKPAPLAGPLSLVDIARNERSRRSA